MNLYQIFCTFLLVISPIFSIFVLANKKLRVRVKAAAQQRPSELVFAVLRPFGSKRLKSSAPCTSLAMRE